MTAKITVHLRAVSCQGVRDNTENVCVYPMGFQAADCIADYGKRTLSGGVYPIGVVKAGSPVERYADQKTPNQPPGQPSLRR